MTHDNGGKPGPDNGRKKEETPKATDLGRRLRELSDKALSAGVERLSTEEIHRRISEVRGRPD